MNLARCNFLIRHRFGRWKEFQIAHRMYEVLQEENPTLTVNDIIEKATNKEDRFEGVDCQLRLFGTKEYCQLKTRYSKFGADFPLEIRSCKKGTWEMGRDIRGKARYYCFMPVVDQKKPMIYVAEKSELVSIGENLLKEAGESEFLEKANTSKHTFSYSNPSKRGPSPCLKLMKDPRNHFWKVNLYIPVGCVNILRTFDASGIELNPPADWDGQWKFKIKKKTKDTKSKKIK